MTSPDRPPPPVSNPITGTWRNSFADKDQKGRDLQKFDRVEELICDRVTNVNLLEINLNFQCLSNKLFSSQEQKMFLVESYF
jgi:hypothetical protein